MAPASNNIRLLVNRAAVAEIRPVDEKPDALDAGPQAPSALPPRPRRTTWVFDGKGIRDVEIE